MGRCATERRRFIADLSRNPLSGMATRDQNFEGTSVSDWIIVINVSRMWEEHSFTKEENVC